MESKATRRPRCFAPALMVALLPVSAVVGCQGEPQAEAGGTDRRVAFADVPEVPVEETASIGMIGDGPPELIFGRIEALAFGQDGELLVLDALAREVRVFDRNGEFLYRFGGAGGGPGELRSPRWLHSGPLHVSVVDGDGRMAVFGPTGELLGERRLPSLPLGRAFFSSSSVDVARGHVLGVTVGSTGVNETASQLAVVVIRDSEAVDTVAVGSSGDVFFRSPVGSLAMGSNICDGLYAAVDSSEGFFVADGYLGTVTRFRWETDGAVPQGQWTVTQPGTPTSQTRIRELRERIPEPLNHPQGELVPPELESPICDLHVGSEGQVWVRLLDEENGELWGALDPFARDAPKTVRFPPGAGVLAFGQSRAAAVVRDEQGVQTIRIFTLPE